MAFQERNRQGRQLVQSRYGARRHNVRFNLSNGQFCTAAQDLDVVQA